MKRQTTKHLPLEGGKFNLKLKQILSSLFIGAALFSFQPSLASADFKQISEDDQTNFESFDVDYIEASLQTHENNDSIQLVEDLTESDVTIDEDESMIATEDELANQDNNIETDEIIEESDIDITEEVISQETEITQDVSEESYTTHSTAKNDTVKKDEQKEENTNHSIKSSNLKQSITNQIGRAHV